MTERTAPECGCRTSGKIIRGMCQRHYDQWVQRTPKDERTPPPRLSRTFDQFIDKTGDCWVWTGPTNRKGYGWWSGNGERGLAHRISLARTSPPSSPALFACHHCDNPPCVNPAHLYWGTVRDNARDVVERGGAWNKGLRVAICKRGHEIAGENVRQTGGRDICRACDNMRSRERQRRYRAERAS
jgi:hypothetical protein